jgi:putative peptidoglycan lipid II flippase
MASPSSPSSSPKPHTPPAPSPLRSIAIAALLVAVGNIGSRILGLGRMSVIAYFFGRGPDVDAYTAALTVPTTVYDLLINGAISAALVPVFSEYAEGDEREFWHIVSSVVNIALLALVLIIGVMIWQAPLVVKLLVQSSRTELRPQTIVLVRMMLPAVLFMGLSGLITAVLYAKRQFLLPAFAIATFNAGIILGAVLFHDQLHLASLAIGMVLGALGQVLLQVPGLRGLRYRPVFNWNHPVVRRILRLYAPVALGISFSIAGTLIDRWLASGFKSALITMQYATTLIQFPLGLVAAAISLAVLPTLSRQDAAADQESFRRTLGMGIKVVLLLVMPATAGLAALNTPIITLLLEYGKFRPEDTDITATALMFYLPSLPAAAVDQLLIFSFYARKNTLTPNLVQGTAIGVYLLTALPLLFLTHLGFLALVIGNSAQWIGHALLMLWLLQRTVPLHGLRLGEALGKAVLASVAMAVVVSWLAGFIGDLAANVPYCTVLQLVVAGGVGAVLYIGLSIALRVEALWFFVDALVRKVRGRKAGKKTLPDKAGED